MSRSGREAVANGAFAEDQERDPEDLHGRTAAYPNEIPRKGWRAYG
jgi:hypothetical protein